MTMLRGRKTYLIAAVMIAYQLFDFFLNGAPFDVNRILEALGLAALRAGVAKNRW